MRKNAQLVRDDFTTADLRVRADSVRMVVVSENGEIYVDTTDVDKDAPRVVMAGYSSPKSDFREPLLRSPFD